MKRIVIVVWAAMTLMLTALVLGDDWEAVRGSLENAPVRGVLLLGAAVLFTGCVVAGSIAWVFALYHTIGLNLNGRSGTFWSRSLLGPVALFVDRFWTDEGLYHRRKLATSVAAFLIFLLAGCLVALVKGAILP